MLPLLAWKIGQARDGRPIPSRLNDIARPIFDSARAQKVDTEREKQRLELLERMKRLADHGMEVTLELVDILGEIKAIGSQLAKLEKEGVEHG